MIFLLFIVSNLLLCNSLDESIVIVKMKDFPQNQIALHMPCEESNFFATKCMCHIKCTDHSCANAVSLCKKYSSSKRCKFVLLRDIGKVKIATLKRTPTEEELSSFDVSKYKNDETGLSVSVPTQILNRDLNYLVENNSNAESIVKLLMTQDPKQQYCHKAIMGGNETNFYESGRKKFLSGKIALVGLNYRSPLTLMNSLKTWNSSGLLDLVAEKLMILNDPYKNEIAMTRDHGFKILQPKDLPKVHLAKPNVVTIGAAFYHALKSISSDYMLFLENDFKMDTQLRLQVIKSELLTAAGMLARGAEVVRLQSRKYQGCG